MEKKIYETFTFKPSDFDGNGYRVSDGMSFRDVLKTFEYDFHNKHTNKYALNMYANSKTMRLLAISCKAAPFLIYGMDLTHGNAFHPIDDPNINHEIDKYSKYMTVYGIDSAYMQDYDANGYPLFDEDSDIIPLTLLTDNTLSDGELRLSSYIDEDGDIKENVVITSPKFEYA